MSDKVYGYCGTNKCKREVLPAGNVAVMSVEANSQSNFNTSFNLPSTFHYDNCVLVSIMVGRTGAGWYVPYGSPDIDWISDLKVVFTSTDTIRVEAKVAGLNAYAKTFFKFVLVKVS